MDKETTEVLETICELRDYVKIVELTHRLNNVKTDPLFKKTMSNIKKLTIYTEKSIRLSNKSDNSMIIDNIMLMAKKGDNQ